MKDTGHADRYPKLSVNYIDHHNPDLLVFDAEGEEMQRIDLTRLRTTANIHKLCRMLGMKETCHDLNPACADWSASNQCGANPEVSRARERERDASKPPCRDARPSVPHAICHLSWLR